VKKIFLAIFILIFCAQNASWAAILIGTYKPETDYGLIDGFKWNFGKKKGNSKFLELKSETETEAERIEREKRSPKYPVQNEYELFKQMEYGVVPF